MAMDPKRKTIVACSLLGLGLIVAVPRLLPSGEDLVITEGELFEEEDEESMDAEGMPVARAADGPRTDLVAAFGSWAASQVVRTAFAGPVVEAGAEPSTAETTEVAAVLPDPPAHRVSLVLLSGSGERAVVDDKVMQVGDVLEAGTIVAILEGSIVVEAERGELVYELGLAGAVGYRSSQSAATDGDPDGSTDADDWEDDAEWEQTLDAVMYGDLPEEGLLDDLEVPGLMAEGDDG